MEKKYKTFTMFEYPSFVDFYFNLENSLGLLTKKSHDKEIFFMFNLFSHQIHHFVSFLFCTF